MDSTTILKTDSRGRITLPSEFKNESLFECINDNGCLVLYPVQTVRKFPKMDDLPITTLNTKWQQEEKEINEDMRYGIIAKTPKAAQEKLRKRS
ncbi:MraZ N-terminal domain containing protein [bacterium]|nr:MraZ N-terminal domain containing protein [bacterium]